MCLPTPSWPVEAPAPENSGDSGPVPMAHSCATMQWYGHQPSEVNSQEHVRLRTAPEAFQSVFELGSLWSPGIPPPVAVGRERLRFPEGATKPPGWLLCLATLARSSRLLGAPNEAIAAPDRGPLNLL